jgi:hypothetical protein
MKKKDAKARHEAYKAKHESNPEEVDQIPVGGKRSQRKMKVSPRKTSKPDGVPEVNNYEKLVQQFSEESNRCRISGLPLIIN